MDTSGFYNLEFMLRAGKFVYGPGYTLLIDLKDTYQYPVDGWYYFDSVEEAATFFGVNPDDFNLDLPPTDTIGDVTIDTDTGNINL